MTVQFDEGSAGAVFLPSCGRRLGGVLICHERYGLVQHTLDLAERLAADGFVAIAPDFYAHWDGDREALARGDIMVHLDDDIIQRHLAAAFGYAEKHLKADPARFAVIGVCLSGSYSLLAADVHPGLAAAVMMYGGAGPRDFSDDRGRPYSAILPTMRTPVMGVWGEADHVVSLQDVLGLRDLFERHGVSYDFTLYPGMPHGWLNSTMPGRYRPAEAEAAISAIESFIAKAFAGGFDPGRRQWSFSSDVAVTYDFSKNVRLA